MSAETCPECGAVVAGGGPGCHALLEELNYEALQNPRIASVYILAFDTYCMQHVETYCVSAKSYAAHLTRLCIGVEHNGDQAIYAALQRWYHGGLTKPEVLDHRGTIRLVDVQKVDDVEGKVARIREWARHVWDVYASQHERARGWIEEALNQKRR